MDGRILAVELGLAVVGYGLLVVRHGTHPTDPSHSAPQPVAQAMFLAGILVLAVALISPLHGVAERSLAGHMVQHVLLVSVAAPLLAVGRPLDVVMAAFGRRPRRQTTWPVLAAAAVVQVVVLLAWHTPPLFDAAVRNPELHEIEHAALTLTAFVLWDVLCRLAPSQRGGAVLGLFVATLPPMAYGVALTLAATAWYSPYAGGGAVADQELAGVVMWAYGGTAAVIGGVALGVGWLRAVERSSPGLPLAAHRAAGGV